jgi:hypothetical protein
MSHNMYSLAPNKMSSNETVEAKPASNMPSILSRLTGVSSSANIAKVIQIEQERRDHIPPLNSSLGSAQDVKRSRLHRRLKHYHHHFGHNTRLRLKEGSSPVHDLSREFIYEDDYYEVNSRSLDQLTALSDSYSALLNNETNYVNYTRFINQIMVNKMSGVSYKNINNTNASLRSVKEFLEAKDSLSNKSDSSLSNVNTVLTEMMRLELHEKRHKARKMIRFNNPHSVRSIKHIFLIYFKVKISIY